jgi:hypothetical protein
MAGLITFCSQQAGIYTGRRAGVNGSSLLAGNQGLQHALLVQCLRRYLQYASVGG